jgi:toxin ParE1/3/4
MEEEKKLPVKISQVFNLDLDDIYQYSIDTFGIRQAELYENEIWKLVEGLSTNWPLFSECRHLPTKSKMYRWIILESHLIIYRITDEEIQVLRIVHSNRSIIKIRSAKRIKL